MVKHYHIKYFANDDEDGGTIYVKYHEEDDRIYLVLIEDVWAPRFITISVKDKNKKLIRDFEESGGWHTLIDGTFAG